MFVCFVLCLEMCLLSGRVSDYPYICYGKTRIPGTNDAFEFEITDVRYSMIPLPFQKNKNKNTLLNLYIKHINKAGSEILDNLSTDRSLPL